MAGFETNDYLRSTDVTDTWGYRGGCYEVCGRGRQLLESVPTLATYYYGLVVFAAYLRSKPTPNHQSTTRTRQNRLVWAVRRLDTYTLAIPITIIIISPP